MEKKSKKISRKIFQPDELTEILIKGIQENNEYNFSSFINDAVKKYFTPINPLLKKEYDYLCRSLSFSARSVTQEQLKTILTRCVYIMNEFPIMIPQPLEQILFHFIPTDKERNQEYSYYKIVDDYQDKCLRQLNEILKTVEPTYNLGTNKIGEGSKTIFQHWNKLCNYPELYIALSIIIELEDIYFPLDAFHTFSYIKALDEAIIEYPILREKEEFMTEISIKDKYQAIRYAILTYQTENGYKALSKDYKLEHIPEEIKEYLQYVADYPWKEPDEITENDLNEVIKLENKGRSLFRMIKS